MRKITKYLSLFLSITFISINLGAQSRIQNLSGAQHKGNVQLNFVITEGESCAGYQIQRSENPFNFDLLYDFSGICGDLIKPQSFSYTDESPLKNTTTYYRVFIPPLDYSDIISLTYFDFPESGYILFSNPVTSSLKILVNSSSSTIEIYDGQGNKLFNFIANSEGYVDEPISSIPNGLYYFLIKTKNEKILKGRFLKEK